MALQEDWRWCGACEGLVYSEFGDGICFDEGPHQTGDSGRYGVGFDEPPAQGFQEGWLWCARCQGLFTTVGDGHCFDGEAHDPDGSRPYWVHLDQVPDGAQDGWRSCARCSRLIYVGFGDGICWDGAAHDHAQSGAYSVDMLPTAPTPAPPRPPPPPPPPPVIALAERSNHIEVSGSGFTPGGRVALSFTRGNEVKRVQLTAGGDGSFEYVERGARPSSATGIVMGRDDATGGWGAARLERLFPYPPDGTVRIDPGTELEPG